jgi:hypothetical protein
MLQKFINKICDKDKKTPYGARVNLEWFPQLDNEMCAPKLWPCNIFALKIGTYM